MTSQQPHAVLVMGPTAAGKTELALQLAHSGAPVDLISVDSAMVYRGMDIGTAKPPADIRSRFPHALVDIRDPTEAYNAAAFLADVKTEVAKSIIAGRVPLLVGGSMLYFKVLRTGIASLPSADAAMRERIQKLAAKSGWEVVHAELEKIDPDSAKRLAPTDSQRLTRALEVCWLTGEPFSVVRKSRHLPGLAEAFAELNLKLHWWALNPPRELLHKRIIKRFTAMLKFGFVDEVRALASRSDVSPDLPSMRSVGYRQIYRCLTGDADWEKLPQAVITATNQMAKRQQTWIRSWDDLTPLPEDIAAACAILQRKFDWPTPAMR